MLAPDPRRFKKQIKLKKNMEIDIKKMHWSEIIAHKIAQNREAPYTVAAGVTPSGPVHPGTLCEFLYAYAIAKQLEKYGEVKYVFISDDSDDFDSIPEPMKGHEEELKPELGKPLVYTNDPKGCHISFADHFIDEIQRIMEKFGVKVEFLRASEMYREGKYDAFAIALCENVDKIKEIVRKSSLKDKMREEWFPIVPMCPKCFNLAKNKVLEYREGGEYKMKCVKCGYEGWDHIEKHRYKLLFRLDWPTRQKFLEVDVEGGSVDHHTRGGTISTAQAIHREFYKEEPPITYKFGFLKYKGKKYSKSKGIGHTVEDLLKLLPVEVIKYMLYKPDIQEDKELVIDKETLFKIFDDFKRASQLDKNDPEISRADRKRAIAFELCEVPRMWKFDLPDMILYYNIYRDWEKVKELLSDPEGVEHLRPHAEEWYKRGLIPDRYMFEVKVEKSDDPVVKAFVEGLKENMSAQDIHNWVFEVAKNQGTEAKEVFKRLYNWLIKKDMGPRLGKLVYAIGVKEIKKAL